MVEESDVASAAEWEPPAGCWIFLRSDEGHAYWLGAGEAMEVGPRSVLVLPPSRTGLLRVSQLSPLRCHWFRFCPDMMGGVLTMSELHLFKKQKPSIRLFPPDHAVAVAFHSMLQAGGTENGFLTRGRMLELMGLVFGCDISRNSMVEGAVLSASKRIKLLMEHLTEEEFIRASIEELAAWCGCSVRHFNRLFREEFAVSLRVRQTESRLIKASRLLDETDSRVMTIAMECGYRHLGVFNALFKDRFAMTPTEWRRRGPDARGTDEPSCSPSPLKRTG